MIKNKQTFSIRETVEILVPDKFGRAGYLIAFLLIIAMVGIITSLLRSLPTVVPLYFTLPWGEARLAPKLMLYLLPLMSLFFGFFNLALGKISAKLSPLLPKVLAVATTIVTCMIAISLIGIVQSLIL